MFRVCWSSSTLLLLLLLLVLVVTAMGAGLRCDCSIGGLTYSRVSITCDRNRKAGGDVLCRNGKYAAVADGYDVFKREITSKYESLYRLYRTARDWKGASDSCLHDGGHLAVFDDQEELVSIESFVKARFKNRTTAIALGLRRTAGSKDYQTVTGRHLGSLVGVNWGAGEPYDAPDRQCMMMRWTPRGWFFLSNHDCAEPSAYLCERPLNPAVPDSYTFVPSLGFYMTSPTFLPYTMAEIECVKKGGHLVVPDTQKEADALMNVYDDFPGVEQMYVGIDDRSETGQFTTVLGERMSSLEFQNWAPGALESRSAFARCVTLNSLGFYQLVDCELRLPTVCEWPLH